MKKRIVFSFLLLACIIQLLHTVVPHVHFGNHSHHHTHHHQNHSHENECDDYDNTVSLFFSHVGHTSESFVNTCESQIAHQSVVSKILISETTTFEIFSIEFSYHNTTQNLFESFDFKIPLPFLKNLCFRGPPSFS